MSETNSNPPDPSANAGARRNYKYLDFIMVGFVTSLLCANLIGVTKVWSVGGLEFGSTIIFFPISYLFGDILTEVYGYARSRRVVWAGFAALAFASFVSWVVIKLPPAANWTHQAEIEYVFGSTPRIVSASLIAFFAGELTNSFVLAKLKIFTKGRHLWSRTIGSTIAGESVDTIVFYPLAFAGVWSQDLLLSVMLHNYLLKVGWEIVVTPLTYRIVGALKRAEQEDYFDHKTNFTPFSLKVN
jgi:uncharacterized integral membrane protein (TIGR00697 family)